MSFLRGGGTEEYYQKFIELQERLRKSEEERLKLEMKFNEMVQVSREEEQVYYRKLRAQYKRFLEEDRRRQERNERILRILERIESRAAMLAAKTQRFEHLRNQYHAYLQRVFTNVKQQEEPPRMPTIVEQKQPQNDLVRSPKVDVVKQYLSSLSSPTCREEVLKAARSNELLPFSDDASAEDYDLPKYKSRASNLADQIIHSIHARPKIEFCGTKLFPPKPPARRPDDVELLDYGGAGDQYEFGGRRGSDFDLRDQLLEKKIVQDKYQNEKFFYPREEDFAPSVRFEGLHEASAQSQKPEVFQSTFPKQPGDLYEPTLAESTIPKRPPVDDHIQEAPARFKKPEVPFTAPESIICKRPPGDHHLKEAPARFKKPEVPSTVSESTIPKRPPGDHYLQEAPARFKKPEVPSAVSESTIPKRPPGDHYLQEASAHFQKPPEVLQSSFPEGTIPKGPPTLYEPDTPKRVGLQELATGEEEARASEDVASPEEEDKQEPEGETPKPPEETCLEDEGGREEKEKEEDNLGNDDRQSDQNGEAFTNGGEALGQDQVETSVYDGNKKKEDEGGLDDVGETSAQFGGDANFGDPVQYASNEGDKGDQPIQYDEHSQPIQYDEQGQVIQYDEHGQTIQYDEQGQPIHYDEQGHPVAYDEFIQYDEQGRPIQYDEQGRPIEYDEQGRLIQYDEHGQLIQYDDEQGLSIQYDEHGRPIQYDDEQAGPIQYAEQYRPIQYDGQGRPIQYDEQQGQPIQYDEQQGHPIQYDGQLSQPIQYDGQQGQPIQYDGQQSQYDDHQGQPIQYDEQQGQPIQYDELGRPVQYDEQGQLIPYDEQGQYYDEQGQPLYQYDSNSEYYQQQQQQQQQYEEHGPDVQQIQQSQEEIGPSKVVEKGEAASVVEPPNEREKDVEGKKEKDELDVAKQKSNVMDMLDTDTESTRQEAKVSNDSDFDFSNN